MQPGQTITPGQQPPDSNQVTERPVEETIEQLEQKHATPAVVPQADAPTFDAQPVPTFQEDNTAVHWTASEYIDHAKGPLWFVGLGLALFALVGLTYFLLKDVLAAVLIGLAGITFGIFAGRRPQVLEYAIDTQGIHIGQRSHMFNEFKSFSLTQAGPLPAILLMPLKRFLPPITIFYDPQEEDKIIDVLANYLPHEDREPDLVDRLMSRIRF